jgi:hypothetical protein
MKLKTAIWAIVILCCICLGLWQKENLSIIWREYSSLNRHFKFKDYLRPEAALIKQEITKFDPEAAAVSEVVLSRSHYKKEDERICVIAENLLEYPDNKLFLFELIRTLYWNESIIDPQIALRLAERLIELEPDNANYHYTKCHLLLADRRSGNINAALEEIEYANKCREYGFPYDSYRKQVINVANRAKLGRFLLRELQYFGGGNPFASDVWQELIGRANMAFTDGDTAKGMRITDTLAEMQKRQLRNGDPYARAVLNLRFFSGAYSFGHWVQPQGLELQRVNLTKERARKNRLQLCALMAPPKKVAEKNKDQDKKEQERRATFLAVHPAVHAGEMFVAFLWGWVVLLLISAIRGFGQRNKIGFSAVLLFIVGCVCYFCIAKGFFLASLLDGFRYGSHCYHFSCIDALRPHPVPLGRIEAEELVIASLFLAGPIVAALALWGLGFLRPKKGAFWKLWYVRFLAALGVGLVAAFVELCAASYRYAGLWQECAITGMLIGVLAWVIITFAWWLFRCRIIRLFLVATFLGSVTVLASGYRYIHYLPMIVFVLTGAIIAVLKPGEGSSFKTVLQLFSRKPDVTAVRNKCLRLTVPFIAVYWVLFIVLTPLVAKSINLELEEFKTVDRRVVLPEPDEAYQQLMGTFEAEGLSKNHIYRLLGLVMPEDLPALLQKLKNTEFTDYYGPGLLPWPRKETSEEEKARLEKRREQQRWLNDGDLVLAMRGCGRDVVGVITGFVDKPDGERALVARARLGDSTTRKKLEELLQARMQSELDGKEHEQPMRHRTYLDRPTKAAEIISALACISEPNEAAGRFLDYIRNREVSDLIEDYKFFEGLILLPTTQTRRVLKAYLAKARSWQPRVEKLPYGLVYNSPDRVLYPLRRLVGFYCDRQIAEAAFKIMLLAADAHDEFEPWEISPYITGESTQLLKKGLESKNENMRAWCIWQLRKVEYKPSKEELDKLLTDKSWKVRANVVCATGKQAALSASKDENSFVRLVASFWLQDRH